MIARLLSLTLLASLLAPVARADDLDNITFRGTVRDSAGAVIPAARVTARHLATGVERSNITDDEGRYRIIVAEPGVYKLKVTAEGFREEESRELTVALGRAMAMDFALTPAGVSEQVTIESSAAPLVDTTRTVTGDTISRKEIDELPILNRNALQLVFLLAGVTEAPLSTSDLADEGKGVFVRNAPEEAGIFSLTGAPATSNNLTIDGLDNNDDRGARERILLNPEAIAEVQIITNQYAAEYGRASGGRINLRTRSGGSDIRGDAYFYFGDESLNANTFNRNARGLKRVPQQERREGVVVSGPIRKKKDFFLASYERVDVTDSDEIIAFVPVETNPLFPLPKPNRPAAPGSEVGLLFESISTPESRNIFNFRADFNFTDRHNATARVDASRGENRRGFPGGARLLDTLLVEGRNSDSVSLTDNFMISTKVINQARFQYSRLLPRNSAVSNSIGVVISDPRVIAGSFTGSESSPAFAREERRAQFQDNILLLAGAHQIKAGIDAQLVRSVFTDLFATGGQYTFDTVDDFLSNRPSRFVQRFDTTSRRSNNVLGVFAQDDWRIKPYLTFSFGVRWDSESILDDRDNFSPRLAIAWDPFGASRKQEGFAQAGRTVVRAGFGIFYNRALLRTIDDFSLGTTTVILDSRITPDLLDSIRFPHPVTDRSLIGRFGLSEKEFLRRVDANLEIPYTIQTGLGVEREITKRLAVSADYIFTRGAHLWRESNINAPVLPSGFADFTEYLLSRDFDNRPDKSGRRPITSTSADVVRFDLGANSSSTAGAIRIENGIRLLTLGLNAPRSTNIAAALNAVRFLRPDPSLTQIDPVAV
ncbi:MAG: TonB-dependent receptor [Acidobacteriota bacterium]